MKFLAFGLGAVGLARLTLAQGTTTIVTTITQVMISVPAHCMASIPVQYRREQADPITLTPPSVPYSTVTNCHPVSGTSSCWTNTLVCPSGSTTTLQTWISKDCNWSDMTRIPQPTFTCSATLSSYMACLATGSIAPPPIPTRTQRLVAKYAQAAPILTAEPGDSIISAPQAPKPTSTNSDFGGGRSQRLVGQHISSHLGGRNQRWVAREAQVIPTADLGGHNRYVKPVAEDIFAVASAQKACFSGFFGPTCGVDISDGPKPTTLETVLKA